MEESYVIERETDGGKRYWGGGRWVNLESGAIRYRSVDGAPTLFYDTDGNKWHRESSIHSMYFGGADGNLDAFLVAYQGNLPLGPKSDGDMIASLMFEAFRSGWYWSNRTHDNDGDSRMDDMEDNFNHFMQDNYAVKVGRE